MCGKHSNFTGGHKHAPFTQAALKTCMNELLKVLDACGLGRKDAEPKEGQQHIDWKGTCLWTVVLGRDMPWLCFLGLGREKLARHTECIDTIRKSEGMQKA